jgi:naphthoate synthase
VRNAFRPLTVKEMQHAFSTTRATTPKVGVVILPANGRPEGLLLRRRPARARPRRLRRTTTACRGSTCSTCSAIRTLPKPVIAMVAGYAIGGGHVLHMICDLTIAADNARFGQTGPKVGSFDGGYGASYMARIVGPEEGARDLVPLPPVRRAGGARHGPGQHRGAPRRAGAETVQVVPRDARQQPLALRFLKAALNADCDGQAGLQELAGNATLLFYLTEEGRKARRPSWRKRKPDFMAVCGTVLVAHGHVPLLALLASLPVGALATTILVVNNVRDRETDVKANKRTLAVRFGRRAGELEQLGLLGLSYLIPPLLAYQTRSVFLLLPLLTLPLAFSHYRELTTREGAALNPTLGGAARLLAVHGALLALGLFASGFGGLP